MVYLGSEVTSAVLLALAPLTMVNSLPCIELDEASGESRIVYCKEVRKTVVDSGGVAERWTPLQWIYLLGMKLEHRFPLEMLYHPPCGCGALAWKEMWSCCLQVARVHERLPMFFPSNLVPSPRVQIPALV